ncbi:uncharacterized protein LOC116850398 [Odontomachus brunneus]|uniref:uncharacterized protein LOC116850398 n=1 Tax=Odontomachus brunneus TaxID=486640 RepID=UPI0013F24D28|nr:uncharacterized protein LOC116850398 [Odontomachus brunneus]
MKKGARCVVQTINLSKPKTCIRPRGVEKLVGTDTVDSSTKSDLASGHWTLRPVTVKVCTREDMQRTCKSKYCDCREKPLSPPLSTGERLCRTVMFLIKGTITAGLIYWTCSEGLWSDSGETENLYYRIMSTIAPSLSAPPSGANDIHLSHLEQIKYSIFETYNDAVMKSMDIIIGVPLVLYQKLRDILFPCDAIKETGTQQSDKTSAKM